MTRRFIGVRWWLGAAFAVVAAVSTAIVVSQFSTRSENAFRGKAEDLAAASAFDAAQQVDAWARRGERPSRLAQIAKQQNLELHVYDAKGRRVAAASPASGGRIEAPQQEREVLGKTLAGARSKTSTPSGGVFVVGIPLRDPGVAALVALSARPDVANAIGIVSDQALRAGVIAGLIGVLVGLVLAQLIALRLRRLAAAAEAIALGDFETPLRYRFRDEFGALAQSFERMRRQVRRTFRQIEGDRDRLRLLLERLHEGVVTVDQDLVVHFANTEARRLLGGRLAEGDALPEPWETFSLRTFADRLFEADASLAQAHELRTPLTTIIGAVEVLQAGAKDDPVERDRFLAHIEREAARLARLARALLTLARAHAGQERARRESVRLAPLLHEVADDLRPHDGVVVEVDCPPDLAANVNRDLLEQALRNLGENAAKHTPEGRVALRAYAAGTTLRVEVEDTGVGMTADTQQHVFDRFFRGRGRDAEGFGLGLAIVRQVVRSIDGRIELDSAPGKGTRVRIVLERARVREEVPVA